MGAGEVPESFHKFDGGGWSVLSGGEIAVETRDLVPEGSDVSG
jgi:hypothetical protein